MPGYVPFALFVALETAAVLAFGRRRSNALGALLVCARCTQLHDRTERVGRIADAVAVGALAFLVALPFVAATYESGFTIAHTALAISAVAAVLAVAAEANFLVRRAAAALSRNPAWSAEPARIIGGGARWLGLILVVYLFHPYTPGITALFGGVGQRLVLDLGSAWTIYGAAVILAAACLAAIVSRWLVPLVSGSLPTTLAARREPHGTPG
jgi:hypothetical protein